MKHAEALNKFCFQQPHWQLIARGADIETWLHDGQVTGTGGIKFPVEQALATGHFYYRFTSHGANPRSRLGGGWWISFDTFNTIKHYAQRNHLELRYAARLFLAVPYEWNLMTAIVKARLIEPLNAYIGEGKPAKTANDSFTPMQHIKVTQMYIPGLALNDLTNPRNKENHDLYKRVWADDSLV